jgi:hypothetical protein
MSAHVLTSIRTHRVDDSICKEGVLLPAIFSVVDPKMFILDPVSGFFSIPCQGSNTKKSREQINEVSYLFL